MKSDKEESSSDEEGGPATSTITTKDKYSLTPEEQKKQKLRDRKKNKRKRKRQQQGIKRVNDQKEAGGDEEEAEEVKEHPLTVSDTVRALKEERDAVAQVGGGEVDGPPKKRVYGVQIDLSTVERSMSSFLPSHLSLHSHAASRNITQHHAAPRSTTQHHAAPRSTTQHHASLHATTQPPRTYNCAESNLGYDPVMDKFSRSTEGEQSAQEMVNNSLPLLLPLRHLFLFPYLSLAPSFFVHICYIGTHRDEETTQRNEV